MNKSISENVPSGCVNSDDQTTGPLQGAAGIGGVQIVSTGGGMCMSCGGLIGEPGKVYGWAGKWCYCPRPEKVCTPAPQIIQVPDMETVNRMQRELADLYRLNHQQTLDIIYLNHKIQILTKALDLIKYKHVACECMDAPGIAAEALKEAAAVKCE